MTASLFGIATASNLNVSGTLVPQSFTATAGQTLFTLSAFTYIPGTNSLLVFVNGQRKVLSRNFLETSTTSFTLLQACTAGDYVDVIGFPQTNLTAVNAEAVSFTQAGTTNSRTVQNKLRDVVSVKDFGADSTGATDSTSAIQAAITAGSVVFPPGYYALSGNIVIPSNRKIIVEKGATITNTGGRFTADTVENVEWQIDGWVKSVAMAAAPSKTLWTGTANERGFIEFGYNYAAGTAGSGFTVHGTGKVSGDWTGTPNATDYAAIQNNRKGIACWNAKNVLVAGLEIFGFQGEAVYASFFDTASHDIIFENNNVHDSRHNALNFNNGANGGGIAIRNNRAVNCLQVEIANGECTGNYISGMISYAVYQGGFQGGAAGPLIVRDNTIVSSGISSIAAINSVGYSSPRLVIENNLILNAGQYSIFVNYANAVSIKGNTCIGSSTLGGSYDIGINNVSRGAITENLMLSPGAFSVGQIGIDWATCSDLAVCPTSNIYMATTGTVKAAGNPVGTIASAASLTLPSIGNIFSISGTTNITSVVATGNNGREITLVFQGALTFTDGSNLKLAGNLVTTADDTITLICDGTNWFEKCRSVN